MGIEVARASWAQHVLWAQATWGLSQLSVGAQLPWKTLAQLLSRKGLAGPGRRSELIMPGDQGSAWLREPLVASHSRLLPSGLLFGSQTLS